VEVCRANEQTLFAGLDEANTWDLIIEAEPSLGSTVPRHTLDDALDAIGQFAELKSAWRIGNASGVATLPAEGARLAGVPNEEVVTLRRAALVQDIGHLGVSNTIWDKATWWRTVRSARLETARTPKGHCAPRYQHDVWTATPRMRCYALRAIASSDAGSGRRGSPRARSRFCDSWLEACRTRRSPAGS
jgi:hypothetical protein